MIQLIKSKSLMVTFSQIEEKKIFLFLLPGEKQNGIIAIRSLEKILLMKTFGKS